MHDRPLAVTERDAAERDRTLVRQLDGASGLCVIATGTSSSPTIFASAARPCRNSPSHSVKRPIGSNSWIRYEDEGGDRPDRDLAVLVHGGGEKQHDDQGRCLRKRQERKQADVHERRAAPGMDLGLAARTVALECPLLAAERLHDADAGEPFLQRRQRLGDAVADGVVRVAGAVVKAPARRNQDRQRDQRDERELGREQQQRDDGEHDLQRTARNLDERLADELVQRLHVGRQTRDEHARTLALEEPERQRLQLVEGGDAQRVEEALAGGCREQDLRAHDDRLQAGEAEKDQGGDVERVQVVLLDAGVDRVANERRARQRDQRRRHHGGGRAEVAPSHGAEEGTGRQPDGARRCSLHHATASIASRAR